MTMPDTFWNLKKYGIHTAIPVIERMISTMGGVISFPFGSFNDENKYRILTIYGYQFFA